MRNAPLVEKPSVRLGRRSGTLVAVLAALLLCAVASAQQPPAAGPPADAAAAEAPEAADAAPAQSTGIFMVNPIWLVVAMIVSAFWLYVTSWVCDDARGIGLDAGRYGGLMLGAGTVGLVLTLVIHAVLAFLMLVLVLAVFGFYIAVRNRIVPDRFKFMGAYHRGQVFARVPGLGSLAQIKPRTQTVQAALGVTSKEGWSLDDLVAEQSSLAQAATVLADSILRAGVVRAQKVRFQPSPEGTYIHQVMLDGVLQSIEAYEDDVGRQLVTVGCQLAGLTTEGRVRAGSGDFNADLPGMGQVTVKAQVASSRGKPVLLLELPDWTAELYRSGLEALGMHDAIIKRVKAAFDQKNGSLIISGPAASGRTTTVNAVVGSLDQFTTDVAVLGDPLPLSMDHVRHWPVTADRPLDVVYQEILRDGPGVLVIDNLDEPAYALAGAEFGSSSGIALGGLRSQDAPDALADLVKAVGDGALVGKSATCVLTQRLVRRLCTACREQVEPNPSVLRKLNLDPADPGLWYRPVGCDACCNSGYHGRTGVFGMLIVTDPVMTALAEPDPTAATVKQAAGKAAFRTMYQDGISKVIAGVTTLDEIRRVLRKQEG